MQRHAMEVGRRAASGIPASQDNTQQGYNPSTLWPTPGYRNLMWCIKCWDWNRAISSLSRWKQAFYRQCIKTLSPTQRRYSQIQREALAVIFGLKKFHHFLYGRKFILVTDHKPLVAMFNPAKGTLTIAANRLARWALTLSQYEYTVEYRSTKDHGNADALSRLPVGSDDDFDREEERADVSIVCNVRELSRQLNPVKPKLIAQETAKDQVLSKVQRYTKEGWPSKIEDEMKQFKKLEDSLVVESGCLFYGACLIIPDKLRLQSSRASPFGTLWDAADETTGKISGLLAPHRWRYRNARQDMHILCWAPEQATQVSQSSVDATRETLESTTSGPCHKFHGTNWLVLVDAYSKYPMHPYNQFHLNKGNGRHPGTGVCTLWLPSHIVTDNAPTFTSDDFQEWCQETRYYTPQWSSLPSSNKRSCWTSGTII